MSASLVLLLAAAFTAAGTAAAQQDKAPAEAVTVEARIETGAAPHGMRLKDGMLYLAAAGDERIEVIDPDRGAVEARWPVDGAPLDLAPSKDGWLVTQFARKHVVALDAAGKPTGERWAVGESPSLFAPRVVDGRAFAVSEGGDRLTVFDTRNRAIVTAYETGARPYPAAVTEDGILAFVPNREAGTVSVIDLLNEEVREEVRVCDSPTGGALTRNDAAYLVACRDSGRIMAINTASFSVTGALSEGIGPAPFSVAVAPHGRFAFANNSGGKTVSVFDPETLAPLETLEVGAQPIVMRRGEGRLFVASEGSDSVAVVDIPPWRNPDAAGEANEVVLLGTIHSSHETSQAYSLGVLERTIRAVDPDIVVAEIPPNRLDKARASFTRTGEVREPRVSVFPEYSEVLFPLTREMDFTILPGAAWSEAMNDYRSKKLSVIRNDPDHAEEWGAYQAAREEFSKALAGRADDPFFIHTRDYDRITRKAFAPYDEHFNDILGPGGWSTIGKAHYDLIAEALDRHKGEGKRILITFGSSHKYQFRKRLKKREDIELLDPKRFLRQAIETPD